MEDENVLNVEHPYDSTAINLELIHEFILNLKLPHDTIRLILLQLIKLDNRLKDKYLFIINVSEEKSTINFYLKVPILDVEIPHPISLMVTFTKIESDILNQEFTAKFLFLTRRFIKPLFYDLKFELKTRTGAREFFVDGDKLNEIEIITPDEFTALKAQEDKDEFS
jgi:hypothetical protein